MDLMFEQALLSSKDSKFEDQSLLCLMQSTSERQRGVQFVFAPHLSEIVMIERNCKGQIYMLQGLDRSSHFTVLSSTFPRFIEKNFPIINNPLLQGITVNTNPVRALFVDKSSDFRSEDKRTIVINAGTTTSSPKIECPISSATSHIVAMFKDGNLAQAFTFLEKKRSSQGNSKPFISSPPVISDNISTISSPFSVGTSGTAATCSSSHSRRMKKKKRRNRKKLKNTLSKSPEIIHPDILPTITLGWSTQNAHEYSKNKCTIAGNIRPFLRDGGLSRSSKDHLLSCIEEVLSELPSETCFNVSTETDGIQVNLRKSMMGKFKHLLGGSSLFNQSFRVEGITILIPQGIGNHCDKLNCGSPGMNTVVSINVNVPIDNDTVPKSSQLHRWLKQKGFKGSFPLSVILYSRKCVMNHCKKMADSFHFGETDEITKVLHWALTDRVGSVCDYQHSVWCNSQFAQEFLKVADKKKHSRFEGRMSTQVEAYDKMVSWYVFHFRSLYCLSLTMNMTLTHTLFSYSSMILGVLLHSATHILRPSCQFYGIRYWRCYRFHMFLCF